jgi:hypothetical protein
MSLAFILLKYGEGSKSILDEIKQIDEVKEAQGTFGPYDAVIKIESNSAKEVKQVLNEKIRGLIGEHSMMTLVAPSDNYEVESRGTWEEIRGLSWVFYDEHPVELDNG